MDKRKKMKIKINGEDRTSHKVQPKKAQKEQVLDKPMIKSWDETAASSEKKEDEFEWVLPENGISNDKPQDQKPKTKKGVRFPAISKGLGNFSPLPPIMLTVLAAIILGTGFGFIVWNTVISGSDEAEVAPANAKTSKPETPAETGKAQGEAGIQPFEFFIVQGGVFSTSEAALAAEAKLKAEGVDAITVPSGENQAVLLATAGTLEDAKVKGSELAANGVEVFARSFGMPEVTFSGLSGADMEVMKFAGQLAPILIKGGTGDDATVKQVEEAMAGLKEIPQGEMADKTIQSISKSLQSGAAAYLGFQASGEQTDQETLQKEALFLVKTLLDHKSS